MAVNWDEIRTEYETTDITLVELGDKHGIKYPTIKSRKQRQAWEKGASIVVKDASAPNKDASNRSRVGPPQGNQNAKGHGAPKGNKNALGNSGGGAPIRNNNAVTHGFFRKFFPEETLTIMEQLETRSPLDMLWDNIVIQYTAIIRAQQVMFVTDKEEMIKEIKKRKFEVVDTSTKEQSSFEAVMTEEEYEFQFSWDRHATFLNAQSRAMATLQSLIKQYEDMCNKGLVTEEQRLRVEKLKAEVKALETGKDEGVQIVDDIEDEDE
ncbi:uncharacterized protein YjcR [Brevibacillus sp. AG162]|uniref:phage terminase small subunit n=1 Tax=Brevibacillus sp. AG162 TaxID=2572910 RepID=UPI00116D4482|nr:phage terminase small subunit [Brevibacillus sp. AG162]TQK41954.1 uncharacterized protein YjcR [Brevibacillus sp. AG162]